MGFNNTKYKLKIKTKGRERNFINRNPSQEEDGSIFKTGQLTDFENGLKEKFEVKELNWGDKVSDGIDFYFTE